VEVKGCLLNCPFSLGPWVLSKFCCNFEHSCFNNLGFILKDSCPRTSDFNKIQVSDKLHLLYYFQFFMYEVVHGGKKKSMKMQGAVSTGGVLSPSTPCSQHLHSIGSRATDPSSSLPQILPIRTYLQQLAQEKACDPGLANQRHPQDTGWRDGKF
jgi:hypothetical protein